MTSGMVSKDLAFCSSWLPMLKLAVGHGPFMVGDEVGNVALQTLGGREETETGRSWVGRGKGARHLAGAETKERPRQWERVFREECGKRDGLASKDGRKCCLKEKVRMA